MDETAPLDKYEQHVDLMNECRAFYYSRVQKTEHYREVFSKGQTRQQGSSKEMSPFVSSMQKLQREIVSLLDQDLVLMRQLLTLNEDIEDMKSRIYQGYSKDSFCSSTSSMFYLHTRHASEAENHLATVLSEGDMENMYQKESSRIFNDIETLVIEEQGDKNIESLVREESHVCFDNDESVDGHITQKRKDEQIPYNGKDGPIPYNRIYGQNPYNGKNCSVVS